MVGWLNGWLFRVFSPEPLTLPLPDRKEKKKSHLSCNRDFDSRKSDIQREHFKAQNQISIQPRWSINAQLVGRTKIYISGGYLNTY